VLRDYGDGVVDALVEVDGVEQVVQVSLLPPPDVRVRHVPPTPARRVIVHRARRRESLARRHRRIAATRGDPSRPRLAAILPASVGA
jgi:hypothetical protein